MADKSFAWAASRGLLRKNAVHGEEEARLVLKDYFQFNEKGSMQTAKGFWRGGGPIHVQVL